MSKASKRKNLSQRLETVIKTLIPQHGQNADDLGPIEDAADELESIVEASELESIE